MTKESLSNEPISNVYMNERVQEIYGSIEWYMSWHYKDLDYTEETFELLSNAVRDSKIKLTKDNSVTDFIDAESLFGIVPGIEKYHEDSYKYVPDIGVNYDNLMDLFSESMDMYIDYISTGIFDIEDCNRALRESDPEYFYENRDDWCEFINSLDWKERNIKSKSEFVFYLNYFGILDYEKTTDRWFNHIHEEMVRNVRMETNSGRKAWFEMFVVTLLKQSLTTDDLEYLASKLDIPYHNLKNNMIYAIVNNDKYSEFIDYGELAMEICSQWFTKHCDACYNILTNAADMCVKCIKHSKGRHNHNCDENNDCDVVPTEKYRSLPDYNTVAEYIMYVHDNHDMFIDLIARAFSGYIEELMEKENEN